MKTNLFPALIFVMFYSNTLLCQVKITEASLSMSHIPESGYMHHASSVNSNASSVQNRIIAGLNILMSQKSDSLNNYRTWTASINTDYLHLDNSGYDIPVFPSSLSATDIGVQYYRTLKNNWGFAGSISAGLYTDFEEITFNDVFINAGGIFIKHYSKKLSLGFGAFVNNNFGTPLPWLAFTINWQVGNRYRLDVKVPDKGPGLAYKIAFSYIINDKTSIAAVFAPGAMSYDSEDAEGKRLLSYWQIPIGLENTWHLKEINFYVSAGIIPLRSFIHAEKDISDMFNDNPGNQLYSNIYVKTGVVWKMQ